MKEQKKNRSSKPDDTGRQALKYSGLAFQLLGVIAVGCYLGYWLDSYMGNKVPYMLLLFTLLFTALALYSVYRKLPKD